LETNSGSELADLQLDDHEPPQGVVVVEEEIEEELLLADERGFWRP